MSLEFKLGLQLGFLYVTTLGMRVAQFDMHAVRDAEIATDKLSYLRVASLSDISFETVIPDRYNNWLDQSESDFEQSDTAC